MKTPRQELKMLGDLFVKPFILLAWLGFYGFWYVFEHIGRLAWFLVFAIAGGFVLHMFGIL